MRILRKYRAAELAALALASTFVMATSTCLQGQSLVDAPLPSYYAGHPARMQIAELPPSARIHGEVYDGRPIDGRFTRNPTPRIQIAPQADRNMLRLIEENYKLKAQLKIQEVEFECDSISKLPNMNNVQPTNEFKNWKRETKISVVSNSPPKCVWKLESMKPCNTAKGFGSNR